VASTYSGCIPFFISNPRVISTVMVASMIVHG
jgi:hypothetical protein